MHARTKATRSCGGGWRYAGASKKRINERRDSISSYSVYRVLSLMN
jgi:hypothetical protein